MFPVYSGKCSPYKAAHNWVKKLSQGRLKVAEDALPGAEVAERTVKRLLCFGFWHTGKVMGQVYQRWWRICQEINVFTRFEYHMVYVLCSFVTCLLTLPYVLHIIMWRLWLCNLTQTLYRHNHGCEQLTRKWQNKPAPYTNKLKCINCILFILPLLLCGPCHDVHVITLKDWKMEWKISRRHQHDMLPTAQKSPQPRMNTFLLQWTLYCATHKEHGINALSSLKCVHLH
jgi:hypothetical protein